MRHKFIPILLILVLIPAVFLTSCKKAAPDVDISELQPEDEIVIMQEEAIDNTGEETPGEDPTESADDATSGDTGDSGQDTEAGQSDETTDTPTDTAEATPEPTPEPSPEPVATQAPVTETPGKHCVRAGETL